ncbi:MAG: hypothetical protein GY715_19190 [Planctomycetes bacterium]|nr:hypothetical protein [Planctomycetota bacterium]
MRDEDETVRSTVLLNHVLPDGTEHVDWMIAIDDEHRQPLISFRLHRRLDDLAPGESMAVERTPDHRPAYLTHEGPVSGGRGTVRRLRAGRVVAWRETGRTWTVEIAWDPDAERSATRQQVVVSGSDGSWILRVA